MQFQFDGSLDCPGQGQTWDPFDFVHWLPQMLRLSSLGYCVPQHFNSMFNLVHNILIKVNKTWNRILLIKSEHGDLIGIVSAGDVWNWEDDKFLPRMRHAANLKWTTQFYSTTPSASSRPGAWLTRLDPKPQIGEYSKLGSCSTGGAILLWPNASINNTVVNAGPGNVAQLIGCLLNHPFQRCTKNLLSSFRPIVDGLLSYWL